MSAFRPFGRRKNNTSKDVLRYIEDHLSFAQKNRKFSSVILPVNFRTAWPLLRRAIHKSSPDALLMLGETTGKRPAIETTAQNRRNHKKGEIPIEKSGSPTLFTRFHAATLFNATQKGQSRQKPGWAISHNAGNYLCNFCYWKVLAHLPDLPCIFVHVPALVAENTEHEIPHLARQLESLIGTMQKQLRNGINTLSAQKQLTVPGQKAGRAKRKKGAYYGR